MKTERETIEFVKNHFLKQNSLSHDRDGYCAYRGENGAKCAAGCLIPDESYNEEMEKTACWLLDEDRKYVSKVTLDKIDEISGVLRKEGYDPEFVRALQNMHDMSINFQDFLRRLEKL